ncbi:unnamed protein product [Didymodactylos carnosus]|uniref:Uncharacterized protein n=1 Tax=Didymodactylos carnosus TaxID=1234261 RepID=A0A815V182_9BILA|nr:unnamed protein product [Didymodactylos carnosus]CAF4385218.1 unnamed protein product [Didymodactylos carnosus]
MSDAIYLNTRSKIDYKKLQIADAQYNSSPSDRNSLIPTGTKNLRRQSRVSSPVPSKSQPPKSLSLILFNLIEEEDRNTMEEQQQQIESEHKDQLEALSAAFSPTKQIEQHLLHKILELMNPTEGLIEANYWFNTIEIIFQKLNYPQLCWPEEAAKCF